jgi:hypothetical protein
VSFAFSDQMTPSHLITKSKSYTAENELNKTWMNIDLLKISVISNIFSNFSLEKKNNQSLSHQKIKKI